MDDLITLVGKTVSYHTKAVGVTFDDRQETISKLNEGNQLKLEREPDNEYDPNAIAIKAKVMTEWLPVGYIAKKNNSQLAKELDEGNDISVTLTAITGGDDKNYGMNVFIKYTSFSEPNLVKLVPDIGSGYVMFDEKNHVYYDEDGVQMISGSRYEAEYKPEANLYFAAKSTAKKLNVKATDITDIWNLNGELSMEYGTLIHKGLEVYFNNHELMVNMDKAKGQTHTASNFMPHAIGSIVSKFVALKYPEFASLCKAEVFVRHGNRCGFIDLLETVDGGVIVHDYKIIKELKIINYRVYGKLDNYTLQQNFYRELLEANGYTVKGMVLDQYTGQEWRVVPVKKVELEAMQRTAPKGSIDDDGFMTA